jgi:hypothetical protein
VLDGECFLARPFPCRAMFGLDFARGVEPLSAGRILANHPLFIPTGMLENPLRAREDCRDLIRHSRQYDGEPSVSARHRRRGPTAFPWTAGARR